MDIKVKAASVSIASNSILVAAKLAVGISTGAVSIISEAAHSAIDLFAALIAYFSVRVSGKPADKGHPYGHGKIENVSGVIEAVLIFFAAAYIIWEATHKIINIGEHKVEDVTLGVFVMAISTIVNILVSQYLFKIAEVTDSIALEADAHHLSTDVYTSLGVLIGLAALEYTGLHILDPLIAIIVAAMIIRVAISLTRKAAGPLLDIGLPEDERLELENIVMKTPRVVGYHRLRTRKAGPYREIDFHLILPSNMPLQEAHKIAEGIEDKMRARFPSTHVTTHIEPDTSSEIAKPDVELRRRISTRKTRRSARKKTFNGAIS